MNSRDFRVLFSYEWKSKHNAAAAARNINLVFGNCAVNLVYKVKNWGWEYHKEDRWRPEFNMGHEVL